MHYMVTPRRVAEKLRQVYFKPLVQRDRQNRFESLDMDLDPRCYVRFSGLLDKTAHDSMSGLVPEL